MSTHMSRVTIGTKPLESLIAEFKATLPKPKPTSPTGAGWLEAAALRLALGVNEAKFKRIVLENLRNGTWERATGTKINCNGVLCGAFFYRVNKAKP